MVATSASAVRLIGAVSVDALLVDRLPTDGRSGLVHSAHEQVVNVRTPDGLLCCLSTADLDDAPRTIRIPAEAWSRTAWREGDAVRFLPGELRHRGAYADTTVTLAGATRWDPVTADLATLSPAHLRAAAAVIERSLLPAVDRSPFEAASADELARRTRLLGSAVREHDPAATTAAARSLIGLGFGLTPSGDDILTGLAVLAAADGMRLATALPALVAAVAETDEATLETRTTPVSAATLAEAVAGRARARVHDLVAAIAGDVAARPFADAIARVREIGHTSGADVLTGIRLGLHLEADLRDTAGPPTTADRLEEGRS